MSSLTIIGSVFSLLALIFLPGLFAPLGMLMGVVSLLKGRMENGVAVIVLAGACGYYGATSSTSLVRDYIGSVDAASLLSPAKPTQVVQDDTTWQVVSLETHMTSKDDDPVYDWKLVVKNDSMKPATFHGAIEFQDGKGAKVTEQPVQGYQVEAGTVGIFTGSISIKGPKIARVVPEISAGG
jgi:hypothetical protein